MKTNRKYVCNLLIVFLTACNFTSSIPRSATTANPTSSLPQQNSAASHGLTGNADIIFTNGVILTMDDANPSAQAIAVQGNQIIAVGTNEEVLKHQGQNTLMVDLQRRTLVPGFIDSHQHRLGDFSAVGYTGLDQVVAPTLAQGWTTLVELYVDQDRLDALRALDQSGRLPFRVNAYLPMNGPWGDSLGDWYKIYHTGQIYSPHVRIAGIKIFMDIRWGQTLHMTQADLNAFIQQRNREKWQLAIHTVGSQTHEMVISAFENAAREDPVSPQRHRIEHVLSITPEQIERMKPLGLIASAQLNMAGELIGDPKLDEFIAREPEGALSPWRNIVDAGVILAGGSDWPNYYVDEPAGAPFGSPARLIFQAVTREGNFGTLPYPGMLDQSITAEQALRALTINGAYAIFQEDSLGSLSVGKLADMVILSDNPLSVETRQLNNITVLMTMVDGKVEYCSPGLEVFCPESPETGLPALPSLAETFTGTWQGADLDDGSEIILTLRQTGNDLTGTFNDVYSGNAQTPGYAGAGSGFLTPSSSAQATFDLRRPDGKTLVIQFVLTLSNQDNTLTLTPEGGKPIVLYRAPISQ